MVGGVGKTHTIHIDRTPDSDDYLLRPLRAGRVYCNATQAKAWAWSFQGPSGRNRLQNPTGSQAILKHGFAAEYLPQTFDLSKSDKLPGLLGPGTIPPKKGDITGTVGRNC